MNKKVWIGIGVGIALVAAAVVIYLLTAMNVSVGATSVSRNAEELTLARGEFDPETLAAALPKLAKLKTISFPDTDLTAEEMNRIIDSKADLKVLFTVDINGMQLDQSTKRIDLSAAKPEQLPDIAAKLPLFRELSELEVMTADGSCALSKKDVMELSAAASQAKLHYEFDLFGKHVSTLDERLEYDGAKIGNDGVAEIRDALSMMHACTYVLLDDCGIDNEVMAKLRDDFPDKKVVWRIFLDSGYPFDFLTDEQVLRLTYGLNDENIQVLKYCTDVVYLDIGHNEAITDFSVLGYMKNLQCLIASLASVTDLSPLVNCQNLIWVELIDCYVLTDISPLKDIPSIRYLSISESEVTDISATDSLPNLERFGAVKRQIPADVQKHFKELHPDCIAIFGWDDNPYGYGWRYNEDGGFFEYYLHMREVFHYDDKGFFGNQKAASYCPIYLNEFEGYPWYPWQS